MVPNSRSRALPPISFYARKSPYDNALGETRTHEIDLIVVRKARGRPVKPHRGRLVGVP